MLSICYIEISDSSLSMLGGLLTRKFLISSIDNAYPNKCSRAYCSMHPCPFLQKHSQLSLDYLAQVVCFTTHSFAPAQLANQTARSVLLDALPAPQCPLLPHPSFAK